MQQPKQPGFGLPTFSFNRASSSPAIPALDWQNHHRRTQATTPPHLPSSSPNLLLRPRSSPAPTQRSPRKHSRHAANPSSIRDKNNSSRFNQFRNVNEQSEYEHIKQNRELFEEREKNLKRSLNDAHMQGTCSTMCSRYEYLRRIQFGEIDAMEMTDGSPDYSKCVKKYQRSSAGINQHPDDLRNVDGLLISMQYLMELIQSHGFPRAYTFVQDRLRAVRRDVSTQSLQGPQVIIIYEMIVRFHLLSFLINPPTMDWVQDVDQLNATMTDLLYHYSQSTATPTCQTFEFHCYDVLLYCGEPQRRSRLFKLLRSIRTPSKLTMDHWNATKLIAPLLGLSGSTAADISTQIGAHDFSRVAQWLHRVPIGIAAVTSLHLDRLRRDALFDMMRSGFRKQETVLTSLKLGDFAHVLQFNDLTEASDFLQVFGIQPRPGFDTLEESMIEMCMGPHWQDPIIDIKRPAKTKLKPHFINYRVATDRGFDIVQFIRSGVDSMPDSSVAAHASLCDPTQPKSFVVPLNTHVPRTSFDRQFMNQGVLPQTNLSQSKNQSVPPSSIPLKPFSMPSQPSSFPFAHQAQNTTPQPTQSVHFNPNPAQALKPNGLLFSLNNGFQPSMPPSGNLNSFPDTHSLTPAASQSPFPTLTTTPTPPTSLTRNANGESMFTFTDTVAPAIPPQTSSALSDFSSKAAPARATTSPSLSNMAATPKSRLENLLQHNPPVSVLFPAFSGPPGSLQAVSSEKFVSQGSFATNTSFNRTTPSTMIDMPLVSSAVLAEKYPPSSSLSKSCPPAEKVTTVCTGVQTDEYEDDFDRDDTSDADPDTLFLAPIEKRVSPPLSPMTLTEFASMTDQYSHKRSRWTGSESKVHPIRKDTTTKRAKWSKSTYAEPVGGIQARNRYDRVLKRRILRKWRSSYINCLFNKAIKVSGSEIIKNERDEIRPDKAYQVLDLGNAIVTEIHRLIWKVIVQALGRWQGVLRATYSPWAVIASANHALELVRKYLQLILQILQRTTSSAIQVGTLTNKEKQVLLEHPPRITIPDLSPDQPLPRESSEARPVCILLLKETVAKYVVRMGQGVDERHDKVNAVVTRIGKIPLYNLSVPFHDAVAPVLRLLVNNAIRCEFAPYVNQMDRVVLGSHHAHQLRRHIRAECERFIEYAGNTAAQVRDQLAAVSV